MTSQTHAVILEALRSGKPTSFDDLVARCEGLYPADIANALRELNPHGMVVEDFISSRSIEGSGQNEQGNDALAAPHPLDFDWRFDDVTAESLCYRARDATRTGDMIVALGTPTVYMKAMQTLYNRTVVLHDSNASLHKLGTIGDAGVVAIDIAKDAVPLIEARHIVADPPWYPDYYALFLWWCSKIMAHNGTISLAMAPLNVRPGINGERDNLWSFAEKLGMSLCSIEEGTLRYNTPLFERRALGAAGIGAIPDWRVGSLATLRVVQARVSTERPTIVGDRWDRVIVDKTDLRFRRVPATELDPRLIRVVEGDTLDSVSARDPRRARAMIWTTLNRVYGCHNPALARRLAQTISKEEAGPELPVDCIEKLTQRTASRAEASQIEEALEQLRSLSACESTTISKYSFTDVDV